MMLSLHFIFESELFVKSKLIRFSRGAKKYYINFVDNSLLFPTVKEFSKSVNS